ncbi:MAG: hypothetical protein FJ298_06270 [Planctomycetes bacterium]|nr:hypothetical protein [Planctomycetota bacterium]
MIDEKDRYYSRLSSIPGIRPMWSEVGDWILLRVKRPNDVARRLRQIVPESVVSVPRAREGVLRVVVSDPKTNERIVRALGGA